MLIVFSFSVMIKQSKKLIALKYSSQSTNAAIIVYLFMTVRILKELCDVSYSGNDFKVLALTVHSFMK